MAGRATFTPLFFITHHTKYCELTTRDVLMRAMAPHSVCQFLNMHESFSMSGHPHKHEGLDYVLKSFNAKSKSFKSPGVPNETQWLRTIRNLEKLKKVNFSCFYELV